MTCPACQKESQLHVSFCQFCGAPIVPSIAAPAEAALPAQPPTIAPNPPANSANRVVASLVAFGATLLVLVINIFRGLRWSGIFNAETFGYILGGVGVAVGLGFLVAFAWYKIRGQKPHSTRRLLVASLTAAVLSILSLTGEEANKRLIPQTSVERNVGNLLKQAAGSAPITRDDNWWDSPMRDFLRDVITLNKEYSREVAALDKTALKQMYTPKSYASTHVSNEIIAELQATSEVDQKYASLSPVIDRMRERIRARSVSEKEKADFLKGFDDGVAKTVLVRKDVFDKGQAWLDASIGLYKFTLANHSNFSLDGKKLMFRAGGLATEFTNKQGYAIRLRSDFLDAQKRFAAQSSEMTAKMGVTAADLGTKPPPPPTGPH
jgi:hypothetical protein